MSAPAHAATLLVVGDIHRHWRSADRSFLERGSQDLVLFVGDLGDEDEELVREVAAVRAPKAVILGNHDAWQSFSRRRPTPQLLRSLEALESDHLAYKVREVPSAGISIIGARPFSWGGASLRSPEVYRRLYGVDDMATSAERIFEAARSAQHRDLVILAHNGPTGLSRDPQDIYGKDFGSPVGGDWGDPDLELALESITRSGWRVPCVIAGHMHDRVMHPRGAQRARFLRRGGTLFVNPAVVPRVRPCNGTTVGHYLRMTWQAGSLQQVDEIWVDGDGVIREVQEPDIRERA
jgi:uncharacterized protein (TIGR04168 family)